MSENVMDFFETIRRRKSVRAYLQTPISKQILVKILDAARLAPSASNKQPWHFIIVEKKAKRVQIAQGCGFGKFLAESPVIIVGCGDKRASPDWYVVDTTIALEHIVLAASALDLGACWIGSFDEEEVREMLRIPERFEVIALIALGYPRKTFDLLAKIIHILRPRRRLKDIISLEAFGEPLR
jgi:nitroreductase